MGKEDDELKELWSLFSSDAKLDEKRKETLSKYSQLELNSFPDHMSITTAFDEILGCFSLGGQFKHYYRYGTYSLCENQREKFWFALTNGSFTDKDNLLKSESPIDIEKQIKIREFYKKRLLEQKQRGSSEDVWDERTEKLVHPFQEFEDRR